ncbi:hypothetical protein [Jiella sp. M17.18]|uniref:hypothetical protein n=1 Tax=Jiella sp. M17.18 TaxID=3234247 RepID=UPI0034DFF8E3
MANALFARAAELRNVFSTSERKPVHPGPSPHDCPPGETWSDEFPRPIGTRIIGGMPYVTGLAPIMRIDDIPDLPDDLKSELALRALQERESDADADLSVRRCVAGGDAAAGEGAAVIASGQSTASVAATSSPEDAFGPVFTGPEIRAARQLIALLIRQTLLTVGDAGREISGNLITRDLCRRLCALGLVTIDESSRGHRSFVRIAAPENVGTSA